MPGEDPRARRREIEVELAMIRSQLAAGQGLAREVKSHLKTKQAALESELEKVVRDSEEPGAASQE